MSKNRRRPHRGRREKKKKAGMLSNIILIVALAVFCVSAFQLVKIVGGYAKGRDEYKKIQSIAINKEDSEPEKGFSVDFDELKEINPDTVGWIRFYPEPSIINYPIVQTTDNEKSEPEQGFSVDFDELKGINPDTIGWIRFYPEPSIINYPIVQTTDNEKYLHKTFSENDNTLGTIFLNADNNANFNDRNSIIYGHRMKDGSMFRKLDEYKDKSFWEANPYFYIYTPDGREIVYHIYSAATVKDTDDVYLTGFENDEAYQSYLDMTKRIAIYDTGVKVTTADSVVTLSTCTSASDEHRFVVIGVKEQENQMGQTK